MSGSQVSDHYPLDNLLPDSCTFNNCLVFAISAAVPIDFDENFQCYSHEPKRIKLYWIAFCHCYGPLSLLAILSTLCLVSANRLALSRDFDPLVIIIWLSSESFQSCIIWKCGLY